METVERDMHVFVGGTFDGLHQGHEAVLAAAFGQGERVTIGLTSDRFVENYKPAGQIATYSTRKAALEVWLSQKGWWEKARIIAIDDPYEPAASAHYDGLIVTEQNQTVGQEINRRRRARVLPEVALIKVPLVPAGDGGPISATRLRRGEIDKAGRLIMPEALREVLSEPLGKVVAEADIAQVLHQRQPKRLIAVGDVATKKLLDLGFSPALAIIDLMVGRKPFQSLEQYHFPTSYTIERVASGPGFIAQQARASIQQWASKIIDNPALRVVVVVEGEEDLLALPAIACAPLESYLYYGQPAEGIVEVEVTPTKQRQAVELLEQFVVL